MIHFRTYDKRVSAWILEAPRWSPFSFLNFHNRMGKRTIWHFELSLIWTPSLAHMYVEPALLAFVETAYENGNGDQHDTASLHAAAMLIMNIKSLNLNVTQSSQTPTPN